MQKQVSKQSLAIVALSILLAITMALTATFAAFTDSKTATGTITFAGGVTIEMTAGSASEVDQDGDLSFNLTEANFTFTTSEVNEATVVSAALKADQLDNMGSFTVTNAATIPVYVQVTVAPQSGTTVTLAAPEVAGNITAANLSGSNVVTFTVAAKSGNDAPTASMDIADLITAIAIADADKAALATGENFVVTVEAQYDEF